MKLIITEEQLRTIIENEEYIKPIVDLINTGEKTNIDMAFTMMKGLKIKTSRILEEYYDLFRILRIQPTRSNFFKILNKDFFEQKSSDYIISLPDILFNLPKLRTIIMWEVGNLDNLYSFNGNLRIQIFRNDTIPNLVNIKGNMSIGGKHLKSIPNLKTVGTVSKYGHDGLRLRKTPIESLPKLESVAGSLSLESTNIKTLPSLKYVGTHLFLNDSQIKTLPENLYVGGDLYLENTPLSKTTTEEELRNKIEVKGEIYL